MHIQILQGKDIDFERVLEIRQIRANTFGDGNIKPGKRVPFTDEIIFVITEENNQILAVWCLYEKEISFLWKSYIIKWIGSITAVVKWHGYGKCKKYISISKSINWHESDFVPEKIQHSTENVISQSKKMV